MKQKYIVLVLYLCSQLAASAQNKLVSYEYWFNNDYNNAQQVSFSPVVSHEINAYFNVSALDNGVNVLNIRYKDETGKYSSTLTKLFVKLVPSASAQNKLVVYEYWYNNDYANVQLVPFSPVAEHQINNDLDVSSLNSGVNQLNIRYKDENGNYSSVISKMFVKLTNPAPGTNMIVAYEYWFDDDYNNATTVNVDPSVRSLEFVEGIDLPENMPGGTHVFNIRFKDRLNHWSAVLDKAFTKEYDPSGTISVDDTGVCLGSAITFNSVTTDVDIISWDMGDGTILSKLPSESVIHTYAAAGDYVVKATFQHLGTGRTKDATINISVSPVYSTLPAVNVAICSSELPYRFGSQSITTAGTYSEMFRTIHGCDSLATINFSILQPTSSTYTHTACGSYTWIDGITYTQSNNSAVHIMQNTAGCDSIITLNLTMLQPTAGTFTHTACGSYTWIDGITYTQSNNSAIYVLRNAAGCDSVVTMNLTINHPPDNGVIISENSLIAAATGVSYQWVDCDKNNSIIAGETSQKFTPSVNGNYAVIVSRDNCQAVSDCYNINTVGVDDVFERKIVQYPNPSDGRFVVDLGSVYDKIEYELRDIKGTVHMKDRIKNIQILTIEAEVPQGLYILTIRHDRQIAVFKVLIE